MDWLHFEIKGSKIKTKCTYKVETSIDGMQSKNTQIVLNLTHLFYVDVM